MPDRRHSVWSSQELDHLKIAQISQEASPNGGVGTYVLRLSRALADAGHEIGLLHSDRHASAAGTGVTDFFVDGFGHFDGGQLGQIQTTCALQKLDWFGPDVVHIHSNNNFELEAAIRERYPAIKFLHVYDFCPSGSKFHHMHDRICEHATSSMCVPRMGYKRCVLSKRVSVIWQLYRRCLAANRNNAEYAHLLVASHYVKTQAVASGYSPQQIHVLPYFVEMPELKADPPVAGRNVLYVGRVTREKGLDYFLRAFALIPEPARLLIAGDGMDLKRVKRVARKLRLASRIEYLGWQT